VGCLLVCFRRYVKFWDILGFILRGLQPPFFTGFGFILLFYCIRVKKIGFVINPRDNQKEIKEVYSYIIYRLFIAIEFLGFIWGYIYDSFLLYDVLH